MTRLLRWPLRGVPIVGFALLCAPGLATGADLAPAAPPPPYPAPAPPPPQPVPGYDPYRIEVRLGAFAHSVGGTDERGTYDLNPEIVFARLPLYQGQWWNVFVPRPHVGVLANLEGRTSAVYAGALWSFPLPHRAFLELFVDGAVHNGYRQFAPLGHSGLGCPALFHVGGSLGYAITEHWTAMLSYDHLSNGHLAFGINCAGNVGPTPNPGFNNLGAKLGYAF